MKYMKPMNAKDPNAHYVDANPKLGIQGSIVSAAAIEPPQREIVNAITEAGLIPNSEDMTQLAQAIRALGMREATNDIIGGGYLAESINDPRELAFTNANTVRTAINNVAGANSIPTYYAGEFKDFFEEVAPAGWAVRDGAVLANADVNYPELWMELQKAENAFKLKSLTEWDSLSVTAGGIGGVPYFVLDTSAKTIKLPDTRTDFFRDANGNVGAWQGDAIRNIAGKIFHFAAQNATSGEFVGAFRQSLAGTGMEVTGGPGANYDGFTFDASRVVPTANENRPRNISMLGCVCVEPAKAQRNEATTTTPGAVYLASGADDQRVNAMPNVAMAAGLGRASSRYRDFSLPANGLTYIAPSVGVVVLSLRIVTSISASTFAKMQVTPNGPVAKEHTTVGSIELTLDVNKNDNIVFNYDGAVFSTSLCRFIYAEGAY